MYFWIDTSKTLVTEVMPARHSFTEARTATLVTSRLPLTLPAFASIKSEEKLYIFTEHES